MSYEPKTQDNKCPFCEIVSGKLETPGIFWEDENYIAFLSIDPNTIGFSCVVPKKHYGSDIMKMDDGSLKDFIVAAKKVSVILENYFDDVGRVGVIMEGTGIDHAHIKLVPMHGTEYLNNGKWKQVLSREDFWFDKYEGWISSGSGSKADPDELAHLAKKLKDSQE